MRFAPARCPTCGKPARTVLERLYCTAWLTLGDDEQYEYDEIRSEIHWDSQVPHRDEESGLVSIECSEGHSWEAEIL